MRLLSSVILSASLLSGFSLAEEFLDETTESSLIAQSPYASAIQPEVKFIGSADKLKPDEKAATIELIKAVLQAAQAGLKLSDQKLPVEVSDELYMGKGKENDAHVTFKFSQGTLCKPCTRRISARGDVMPKITDAKNKVVWPK